MRALARVYELFTNLLFPLYALLIPMYQAGLVPEQERGEPAGVHMAEDLLWIAVTIAFFALSIGYVYFCDRVQ